MPSSRSLAAEPLFFSSSSFYFKKKMQNPFVSLLSKYLNIFFFIISFQFFHLPKHFPSLFYCYPCHVVYFFHRYLPLLLYDKITFRSGLFSSVETLLSIRRRIAQHPHPIAIVDCVIVCLFFFVPSTSDLDYLPLTSCMQYNNYTL